jgi:hypothetical protein
MWTSGLKMEALCFSETLVIYLQVHMVLQPRRPTSTPVIIHFSTLHEVVLCHFLLRILHDCCFGFIYGTELACAREGFFLWHDVHTSAHESLSIGSVAVRGGTKHTPENML